MKAYLLGKFTSSDRINVLHYCMFHGEEELLSGAYTDNPSHYLGEDLSDPLSLSRNGRIIPDVFMPGTSLVLSSAVRELLEGLPNIVFLDVVFKKLIDFQFQAGDFSYYDSPEFRRSLRRADPEKLIKRLPDVPAFHERIGRYFEVVVAQLDDIGTKYHDAKQVGFSVPYLGAMEPFSINICKRLLNNYPIVRIYYGVLLRDDVFERINEFIDWDYFSKVEIEIPD